MRQHIGYLVSGAAVAGGLYIVAPEWNFTHWQWWLAMVVICFGDSIGDAIRKDPSPHQGGRVMADEAQAFDAWFKSVNSWGLSRDELLTCAFTPGNDLGDTVHTSPRGVQMTRAICSHWLNFYGAAQMGWNARSALPVSREVGE